MKAYVRLDETATKAPGPRPCPDKAQDLHQLNYSTLGYDRISMYTILNHVPAENRAKKIRVNTFHDKI